MPHAEGGPASRRSGRGFAQPRQAHSPTARLDRARPLLASFASGRRTPFPLRDQAHHRLLQPPSPTRPLCPSPTLSALRLANPTPRVTCSPAQPARRLGRELRWPPSRRSSRGPAGALSLTVRCTLQPRGCLPFKHLDDAPAPRRTGRSRGHCHISARPRHRPDRRHRRSSQRGVRPGHACVRSPTRLPSPTSPP